MIAKKLFFDYFLPPMIVTKRGKLLLFCNLNINKLRTTNQASAVSIVLNMLLKHAEY